MRVLRDTGLVFVRTIRPILRNPAIMVFGLAHPVLFLLFFGPLLPRFGADAHSWQWFVPGLVVQLGLFGTAYAGYALLPEISSGVLERMRVTPVSRVALVVGRVLRDVATLVIQCCVLLMLAAVLGFRASAAEIVLVLVFGALTGVSIATTSYALALKLKHEYAFGPMLGATVMPLMLLSGVLLPMDQAPRWLYILSRLNPLSYIVDAVRGVAAGELGSRAVAIGAVVSLGSMAVCVLWGTRTFTRDSS